MEAAIASRLERVVQEVIEVRQRAQALSDELLHVRAEHQTTLAALEKERAALAAVHVALESERARLAALKSERSLQVAVHEPEPAPTETVESEAEVARRSRLLSPRGLLSKLKFGGRKSDTAEVPEPASEALEAPEPPALVEPEIEPAPAPVKAKKTRPSAPKRFAPREFLSSLPRLTDEQLDLAAFGIVQLADDGRCLALNSHAIALLQTTHEAAFDVLFFEVLLPDSEAAARFSEGVEKQKLDLVLPVGERTLHLYRHAKTATYWALLHTNGEEK